MSMPIRAACPDCGYPVDDATVLEEGKLNTDSPDRPEEGDLALCIRCAACGFYVDNGDGTLGLRLATTEEKVRLFEDADVQKARAAIVALSGGLYE